MARKDKGLTLVEILVAVVILTLIIGVLYNFMDFQIKTLRKTERQTYTQRDIRQISDFLTDEIRFSTEIVVQANVPENFDPDYKYIYSKDGDVYSVDYGAKKKLRDYAEKVKEGNKREKIELTFSADKTKAEAIQVKVQSEKKRTGNAEEQQFALNDLNTVIKLENGSLPKDFVLADGRVVKYKSPDYQSLKENAAAVNTFFHYLTKKGAMAGIDNPGITSGVDGLVIPSSNTANSSKKQSLVSQELNTKVFQGTKGNLYSYGLTVDAKINGENNGFGIMLSGTLVDHPDYVLQKNKNDTGYMFQFDPKAKGFVVRLVKNGEQRQKFNRQDVSANLGAKKIAGDAHGTEYGAVYSPEHLFNTSFRKENFPNGIWQERLKTNIKVQIQPDKSMIMKVTLEDSEGNKSNEMMFGDFGQINLNGTVFQGNKLQAFSNHGFADFLPENQIYDQYYNPDNPEPLVNGGKTWTNGVESGDKTVVGFKSFYNKNAGETQGSTKFYEIKLNAARPAAIKTEKEGQTMNVFLDDKIQGDITSLSGQLEVKDGSGKSYTVTGVSYVEDNYARKLKVDLQPQLDPANNPLPLPDNLNISYNGNNKKVTDEFGNSLEPFEFINNIKQSNH